MPEKYGIQPVKMWTLSVMRVELYDRAQIKFFGVRMNVMIDEFVSPLAAPRNEIIYFCYAPYLQ